MRQLVIEAVGFALLMCAVLLFGWQRPFFLVPAPAPVPVKPVDPDAERHRHRPHWPWRQGETGAAAEQFVGKIALGGSTSPDGTEEVSCDLPVDQRIKNIGSHVDGAGMCVMSSIEMAARWACLEQMRGLRDFCAQQPGGGYPSKTDKQIKEYCAKKGIPVPAYIQYEGSDPSVIAEAIKSGRVVALTYSGRDGVRYNGPIAHMVTVVAFSDKWCAVMDNNGDPEKLIWMSPQEFLQRWKQGGQNGWAFVWLAPGPPPVPRN